MILTGFNTVDDACIRYIDDLWILERRKTRNSTILHVTGAAVAAIIGANPNPSAATLTILAQGFGLAGALNNAIADSYLYSQSASTIKTLVRKTTTVYRNDLAAKVLNKTEIEYPLGSAAAAYFHMREYLALCLPPSIQEQIDTLVTKAKAGVEEPPTAPPVARALIVRSTGASRATTPVGF